jgi:hypothetical protein
MRDLEGVWCMKIESWITCRYAEHRRKVRESSCVATVAEVQYEEPISQYGNQAGMIWEAGDANM